MKKDIFLLLILGLVLGINFNLISQQCEVVTRNIIFESDNSLTFDVYIKNTGVTNWTYSHGAVAWTYDVSFLNGGTPAFSLVPGYSDFPSGAHPPSALITSPDILRTSSNLPGSNGDILPGQSLRLYRFRLQTSASSFSTSFFNIVWKDDVTPYTRIYSWDSGTGLPSEIAGLDFSIETLFLDENFDYGTVANPDLLAVTTNWTRHSGTAGPAYNMSSLNYTSYPSSGIGGSVDFTNGSSGVNDGDVNRVLPASVSADGNIYSAFLLNLSSARTTSDYFFHLSPDVIGTTFRGRVYAQSKNTGWIIGLSKTGTSGTIIMDTSNVLNFNHTYVVVLKYVFSTASTNDDIVTLYVYETGIPSTEPGSPVITIGPLGSGVTGDPANIGSIAIRQGTNTPTGTIDGIRVATSWSEIFSTAAGPTLNASPPSLSGFNYTVGSGPSASQSYNLSGNDLTPSSGNIIVTGSSNYEVSLNNTTFSSGVNVPYTSGALTSTPVYVRLKAGLSGGSYNGEVIVNSGGGAADVNVICNGGVVNPEPSNHVTAFSGVLGNPSYHFINLSWTDASGGTIPEGYLIKGSDVDFTGITPPVDGTPEGNSVLVKNVTQGIQAAAFGLNSTTTYYFKIYPYTNSGTLIDYKTDGTVPEFSITTATPPSLPVAENFNYATGSNLTDNGWVAHSGAGNFPIQVNASPLTYTGYVNSGLGKSVSLAAPGLLSAEDINRSFDSVSSNSVYASFMVNVSFADTFWVYFFHLGPENSSTAFYGKVFVRNDGSGNLAFGVSKNVNTPASTPYIYSLNTTYLIVVKYTFNTGTGTDDEVKLWINPVLDGNEPPSDLTQTDVQPDAPTLGLFALRQAANGPALTIGGLRLAATWVPGSSSSTFQLTVNVNNGWNMVSIPGLHPTNQQVLTWWSGKDPAANVFKYSGGYQAVTDAAPTEGYWMKNLGAQTYNTGDEWPVSGINIVSHDPISANAGWNLIGGYEYNAQTSGITTNPPGLVEGSVFGYSGGYQAAGELLPGYGYWIKLSDAGQIILPPPSFKGSEKLTTHINKDWGKIIITDNSGKSYTLYSVKGKTDLNKFELPPLPPAGIFDIRFASGRFAEVLEGEFKSIDLSGVVYPVKVKVENTAIRLQDESGKALSTNLKPGDEIVINNNLIRKILVSADIIPEKFSLEQNFPNPFNPVTTIKFSVPKQTQLKINLYNILGELVQTIAEGLYEPGNYQVTFSAVGLPSGTYIYRMEGSELTHTKKMVLLK